MTLRYSRFTNVNGHRIEFSSFLINPQDRHFGRESKMQKAQFESEHDHGTRKDFKIPIKDRIH